MKNNLQGLIRMNLQLLAENDGAGTGGVDNTQTVENEDNQNAEETKSYSQEEVDALLQKESDKKVTQALKTARAKWDKEQEEKISEAKRLSKMTAEEKAKAELEKEKAEIEAREKAVALKELQAEAKAQLTDRNLPKEFVALLDYTDADTVKESIDNIEKLWADAVQKGVADKIKGSDPLPGAKENKTLSAIERKKAKYIRG